MKVSLGTSTQGRYTDKKPVRATAQYRLRFLSHSQRAYARAGRQPHHRRGLPIEEMVLYCPSSLQGSELKNQMGRTSKGQSYQGEAKLCSATRPEW